MMKCFIAVALQLIEAVFITRTCKVMTTYGFQSVAVATNFSL